MEDDEWKKLPTDQKLQHKSWKARAEGYKECIKNFAIYEEKSPEFAKYLGLVKKFVTDSNELNRVQGLQAAIVFVTNAAVAGKTCNEVVGGVISKCFNTKPKLRELGIELCQLYVEIDKNETTQEELIKGFDNKQPKIIHACLDAITFALRDFGSKVIQVKPLLKQTLKLVDHRDKNVREATKSLFIEIFRWIGPAIKAPLQNINAVVLKELEEEWEKIGGGGGKQTRFMRSQQDLKEKMEEKNNQKEDDTSENIEPENQIDPFDLLEPVEIISQLPKNFYEQIEAKKWQERKEMLEICTKLTQNPKLATQSEYGDFVKALKKVIAKDTNVMLVTIAIKCIGGLASGLRKKFQPFALLTLEALLDRFKEKKITVVTALEEATDSVFLTTNIPAISESCVEYLANKNPSIRTQTSLFLARSFAKTKSNVFNKSLIKIFTQALLKNVDHGDVGVRESAYKAIGMLLKIIGEGKMQPFIADLDKIKMAKINESAGKCEVENKTAAKSETSVKSTPPKSATKTKPSAKTTKETEKKTTKKKTTQAKTTAPPSSSSEPPPEAELSEEVVEEQVATVITPEVRGQISNSNWKERFAGLQAALQMLKMQENPPVQAFIKVLSIKPGFKDSNFNCLNEKFKIVSYLALNGKFSKTSAQLCLIPTVDKIGDLKCGTTAKEALSSMSESCGFPWITEQILDHSMSQKNPKIQSESITWLTSNLYDFGVTGLNVKVIIQKCKLAFAATNPNVRTSALTLVGVLSQYIGDKLKMFFENEKPTLVQQIDQEIEKMKGESPPAPTKGKKKVSEKKLDNDASSDEEQPAVNLDDLITRVDISDKITDNLLTQLSHKDWKLRKEGLENVATILNEAKFLGPNLGELPAALKARLGDSNKILVTTTLNLLMQLSTALGPHSSKHLGTVSASIINSLADSKPQVRQTALKCMDQWLENTKISMWFEGDTMSTALSNPKHTLLRIELLNWLGDKLMSCPKLNSSAREGAEQCVPMLLQCCEDRSGEVRAKAQACLPGFIKHLGFEKLMKATSKLSASSKSTIQSLLESAKELVPEQPKKTSKVNQEAKKTTKTNQEKNKTENEKPPSKEKKPKSSKSKPTTTSTPSVPEEEQSSLFLSLPNGKEQRLKDEVKLKTIKWNFVVPREELVQQLQQQLATSVSPALLSELFHKDFQHHIKAITLLTQALSTNFEKLIENLDILLRWLTLRFYDKNTTVHIKSLDFISNLFEKLISTNYRFSEYEISAFLPHLIVKIGESKENIRKGVVGILKQVSLMYPASKLFNFVMDGIKSKNSRQRQECLDHLSHLIEQHGITVCQPTPAKALKEIATNISDRDKDVRSSALNAIVAAYNKSGDIVFKQVGKLNEKDMSMLEERIKRSGKFQESVPSEGTPNKIPTNNQKTIPTNQKRPPSNQKPAPSTNNQTTKSEIPPENKSKQDWELEVRNMFLEEHGIDIRPSTSEFTQQEVDELLRPFTFPPDVQELMDQYRVKFLSPKIDELISKTSNVSVKESIPALRKIYQHFTDEHGSELFVGKIDKLLGSYTIQLRMILEWYLPYFAKDETFHAGGSISISQVEFESLCKLLFSGLFEISKSKDALHEATTNQLFGLLRLIFQLMIHKDLNQLPARDHLVRMINMIVHNFMTNSDMTSFHCAMIKTLQDCLELEMEDYIKMSCRCIWKVVKMEADLLRQDIAEARKYLRLSEVIEVMDEMWRAFPPRHEVYKKFGNLPLRSIKSSLLLLCDIIGPTFLEDTKYVENRHSSDIVKIMVKKLGVTTLPPSMPRNKNGNVDDLCKISLDGQLSEIFKKIGNKDQTKQGLQELHDFKKANPEYNVDDKINGQQVKCYRDYIWRGLKKIKEGTVGKCENVGEDLNMEARIAEINKFRTEFDLPLVDYNKYLSMNAGTKILASNSNTANQQASQLASSTNGDSSNSPGGDVTSSSLRELRQIFNRIKNDQP